MGWLALCGGFLAIYVGHFAVPRSAILPHLRIVGDMVACLASVRIAIALSALRAPLQRALIALLLAALAGMLLAYYVIVLIGLQSWGRVTTWELIASYLPHTGRLLDVLGIPRWIVVASVSAVALPIFALAWLHASRWDCLPALVLRLPRRTAAIVAAVLLLASWIDMAHYRMLPPTQDQEPISLSLYPEASALRVQDHGMDRAAAARREEQENRARREYAGGPPAHRRNVVLIVVDSLRADHTSLYGYARDTTPYLSAIVARGGARRAPPVRTSCSETMCGMLSLVSSRYVHQFSRRMFVLHEVLARNGYRRVLILGDDHTHFYGLREQYGKVDEYFDASQAGGYVNNDQAVVDRVRELAPWDGRPVMLQFHLMSAHMLGKRHDSFLKWKPAANYYYPANRSSGADGRTSAAVNYYDDGVLQADAMIAAIMAGLEAKGYLREAVVAITGDHGESIGEHGTWGHGHGVDEEVTRVPLVLLARGYEPEPLRAKHPAQVDIAPTLLAEIGVEPPSCWEGTALQRSTRPAFEFFQQGSMMGLVDRRGGEAAWKYWEDSSRRVEFARRLSAGEANAVDQVPAGLLKEWRAAMLPIEAQVVGLPQ